MQIVPGEYEERLSLSLLTLLSRLSVKWTNPNKSLDNTGLDYKAVPSLRECCRQVEAEVVSNSRDKIHQTWQLENGLIVKPCIPTLGAFNDNQPLLKAGIMSCNDTNVKSWMFQLEELKNLVRGQGGDNPSSPLRELIEMRNDLQV